MPLLSGLEAVMRIRKAPPAMLLPNSRSSLPRPRRELNEESTISGSPMMTRTLDRPVRKSVTLMNGPQSPERTRRRTLTDDPKTLPSLRWQALAEHVVRPRSSYSGNAAPATASPRPRLRSASASHSDNLRGDTSSRSLDRKKPIARLGQAEEVPTTSPSPSGTRSSIQALDKLQSTPIPPIPVTVRQSVSKLSGGTGSAEAEAIRRAMTLGQDEEAELILPIDDPEVAEIRIATVPLEAQVTALSAAILPANRDIPIICITANSLYENRVQYLKAGMDEVLTKPFNPTTVTSIVSKFIGRFQAAQQPSGRRREPSITSALLALIDQHDPDAPNRLHAAVKYVDSNHVDDKQLRTDRADLCLPITTLRATAVQLPALRLPNEVRRMPSDAPILEKKLVLTDVKEPLGQRAASPRLSTASRLKRAILS
ncbi:hypothetical protein DFS34DRAFT_134996 [Phlyctochytrium arcticum]|nr:hypothetical protein DFS34DRAFT_134996 [Phlyctochytrium arcticum]